MKGAGRFEKALVDAAQGHVGEQLEQHRGELVETLKNHIFDLEGPRQLAHPLNPRDKYFWKVFRGFTEITRCLETLDDIVFYARRFPFAGTKIAHERYLQFHVEAHFSEIYILRERLTRYATLFERQFRRDPQLQNVRDRCATLRTAITEALRGVTSVRGQHIHEMRFSDDAIDRVTTIGLLARGLDGKLSKLMKEYHRIEYRRVRKIWVDRTRDNTKALRGLLDAFFDALFPIVFDEETSNIRYPDGVRA